MKKFRLRNNAVIEGQAGKEYGWFNVVKQGGMSQFDFDTIMDPGDDERLRLIIVEGSMPLGGAWGKTFDAVEEL